MPRTGSPADGNWVEFAQIFSVDERNRLTERSARITGISGNKKGWKVDIASSSWQGHRIGLISKIASKISAFVRGKHNLGQTLLTAYVDGFHKLTVQTSTPRVYFPPDPATGKPRDPGTVDELSTPLGFRIAAAMDLAGVCALDHGSRGRIRLKTVRGSLDNDTINRVDYLVNLSPQRLALEFVAAGHELPNGYLDRVLVPHYLDRLMDEAGMDEDEAWKVVHELQEKAFLELNECIGLESLMEMRNGIDRHVAQGQRKVSKVEGGPARFTSVPKKSESSAKSLPESVKEVSVGKVLEQGRASRQGVRDYLIQELRKQGESREKARERVVAALESMGVDVGKSIPVSKFQLLARHLRLFDDHSHGEIIRAYLGLVNYLDQTAGSIPQARSMQLLKETGLTAEERFVGALQDPAAESSTKITVIERPALLPPSEDIHYNCNDDELWTIKQMVDNRYIVRLTKDMMHKFVAWAARSKGHIASESISKIAAAIVTGTMTGGLAGGMYLLAAVFTIPAIMGVESAWSVAQNIWHRRKVDMFDAAEPAGSPKDPEDRGSQLAEPDEQKRRKTLYSSLGHVASEKSLLDAFNSFSNLKRDMKGIDALRDRSDLSAKEQIKFRRHQVVQQLRSHQLGESLKDVDRLMVELVSDISVYEDAFEPLFGVLWQPFNEKRPDGELVISEKERAEIFSIAANKVRSEGALRIAKGDQRRWLRGLVGKDERGRLVSDGILRDAFKVLEEVTGKDLEKMTQKESREAAALGKLNWALSKTIPAAKHTVKTVAHFIYTNVIWNAAKLFKMGTMWVLRGLLPREADLMPVPTAAMCVYWVISFIGGRTAEMINNRLNRLRVKKIASTRYQSNGNDKAFDAEVKPLSSEDWRALRREGRAGVQEFVKILGKLRKEHRRIAEDAEKMAPNAYNIIEGKSNLVERAVIIVRRKYLEQQLQELLSGAVGMFYQETIRGEWLQRQLLDDVEQGVPPKTATPPPSSSSSSS